MSTLEIYRNLLANLPLEESFDWISSTFGPDASIIEVDWLASRKDRYAEATGPDFDTLFDVIDEYLNQRAASDPWKRERLVSGVTTLPVTVITKTGNHVHQLTRDTAAGLALFFDAYRNSTGKSPYRQLRMSLKVNGLSWKFPHQEQEPNYSFSIRVHRIRPEPYAFATYDFYAGFITAANWLNVDHRKYADSLYQYQNGTAIQLQM